MSISDFGKRGLGWLALALSHALGDRSRGAAGILMYHRIAPRIPGLPPPTLNVTPERFTRQILGLRKRGYRFVALGDVLRLHKAGTPLPAKSVVLTFDDIFEGVFCHAWPLLRQERIPATMFVATSFLDAEAPFPFDPWGIRFARQAPSESYRPVRARQCQEMLDSGLIEIGAHTHTHADFSGRPHEFARDLELCVDALRSRFGVSEAPFAFPYGRVRSGHAGGELSAAAKRVGVTCALTTEYTLVRPGDDPYQWGRLGAYGWDTTATLTAKLQGWYGVARGVRAAATFLATRRRPPPVPAVNGPVVKTGESKACEGT